MTTIQLRTITLHLCPRGLELYNVIAPCVDDVKAAPCLDTKQDCHKALRDYFKHRRGVRRSDGGYVVPPCPDCRIETFDASGK